MEHLVHSGLIQGFPLDTVAAGGLVDQAGESFSKDSWLDQL